MDIFSWTLGIPWYVLLAVASGTVVPVFAFLWEYGFFVFKRLGYRVQMDTAIRDEARDPYARALREWLPEPSFVLLRIENDGTATIEKDDYETAVSVEFPGRRVVGFAATEFSDSGLREAFPRDWGVDETGRIRLPKVELKRPQHYKILVVLDRVSGEGPYEAPRIAAGAIRRGVRRIGHQDPDAPKGIRETESRIRTSGPVIALISLLVTASLTLGALSVTKPPIPLDCATGRITLTGSTAFEPVLLEAANAYEDTCPEAAFTVDAQGSENGLNRLDQAGQNGSESPDMLAFSDGRNDDFPRLTPRPIAVSLFTLVINTSANVPNQNLSLTTIRRIYRGEITNWRDVGGGNVPIRLVSRDAGSGTRRTFEARVLGTREPGAGNCPTGVPLNVPRCEASSTSDVLDAVAQTRGAIGYTELQAAIGRQNLRLVRIDGQEATAENVTQERYPFWQTEYAYTFGEPETGSLTAGFLRYLTNEVGQDIVRAHGHRPCTELQNPTLCNPS